MMSMQELFYGDREPTWIIPSYPHQEIPRVYHQQQPHMYYQDHQDASRYRMQYQRSQVRARSPKARIYHDALPYAETRYNAPGVVEKRYRPSVMELMVPMCCTKCEEKVKEALLEMEGVEGVKTDQENHRVTVTGFADPMWVLKRVKKIKKRSQLIMPEPQIPSYQQQQQHHTSYESAKSYSRYPQSSQVHTQAQSYYYPGEALRAQEFNYDPHNFYAASYIADRRH